MNCIFARYTGSVKQKQFKTRQKYTSKVKGIDSGVYCQLTVHPTVNECYCQSKKILNVTILQQDLIFKQKLL